ncbi:hypothetical protein NOR_04025 [Metarhizium rileyi]|uniref:Uncharacterized protein n=1 Tax=Metarhizium rileyi (strain RCEF 4871) TaxID=1649241 RepID=A0A167ER40_METRR|nr:hypothetical protein NOR_04025 [Metarhizium rileyi RCEF 4871]
MALDPEKIDELLRRVRNEDFGDLMSSDQETGLYYCQTLFIDEEKCPAEIRTERAPSLATSATGMSPAFDTFDSSSVYSSCTDPPPLYGPEAAGRQRPAMFDDIPSLLLLPCEFEKFSGCSMTFSIDDENRWINHIINEHLHGCLPKFSICWFCDGRDAEFRCLTNQTEAQISCYRRRMYHIADHFRYGKTAADIRPDFHFLDHLHNHQLIDEAVFQWAKKQGEFPSHHMPHRFRAQSTPQEVCHVERAKSGGRRTTMQQKSTL